MERCRMDPPTNGTMCRRTDKLLAKESRKSAFPRYGLVSSLVSNLSTCVMTR